MTHSPATLGSAAVPSRRLIDCVAVSKKCGWSLRNTIRAADQGLMPASLKIGRLRRWDEFAIDQWIAGGCQSVRPVS